MDIDDTEFVALTEHIKGKLWTGDKELSKGLLKQKWNKLISTEELHRLISRHWHLFNLKHFHTDNNLDSASWKGGAKPPLRVQQFDESGDYFDETGGDFQWNVMDGCRVLPLTRKG